MHIAAVTNWKHLEAASTFVGLIDNLRITFDAADVTQVDARILLALRREAACKANCVVDDPQLPRLVVLERRLRIGTHNGLCYIEEPLCLPLEGQDGSLLRHRSHSLSRASKILTR